MGKKYSERKIDYLVKKIRNWQSLYTKDLINYRGRFPGAKIFYSERIAQKLLEFRIEKRMKENIRKISRKESYYMHKQPIAIRNTYRCEENFAKSLFNDKKTIGLLGKIIECQVPLKDIQKREAGKIDLISLSNQNVLYLIELKYGNNTETLLRAVLEIATYYNQLDRSKLISDFSSKFKRLSVNRIRKAVILGKGTQAYREAKDLANKPCNRPYLSMLIKRLKVEVVFKDTSEKL